MSDERDFIEKAQSMAKNRLGRELTPSEMATEFAQWGLEDRNKYLDAIDGELAPNEPLSIGAAARRHAYNRALRNTHENLRKIER